MPKLLIAAESSDEAELAPRFGGRPLVDANTAWPRCRECKGPMQFLGQIPLSETGIEEVVQRRQLLLLFLCRNDPGMCDDWNANSGANAAVLVPLSDLTLLDPPALTEAEKAKGLLGETALPKIEGIVLEEYDDSRSAETPDDAYVGALEDDSRKTVGKLGGRPLWLQSDETPRCDCGKPMTYVAQIESAAAGGINFGDGGVGYAFVCSDCESQAKFLWQG